MFFLWWNSAILAYKNMNNSPLPLSPRTSHFSSVEASNKQYLHEEDKFRRFNENLQHIYKSLGWRIPCGQTLQFINIFIHTDPLKICSSFSQSIRFMKMFVLWMDRIEKDTLFSPLSLSSFLNVFWNESWNMICLFFFWFCFIFIFIFPKDNNVLCFSLLFIFFLIFCWVFTFFISGTGL